MTGTLTASTPASTASILEKPLDSSVHRDALYAPIDEHRAAASLDDVAAAWLAAGLVGLGFLAVLAI